MGDNERINGNRPKETSGDSLESAQAFLEGGLPSDANPVGDEWEARFKNETEAFYRWAIREGRLVDFSDFSARLVPGGMEHDVWFDEDTQRWFKLTHPNEFGRYPEVVDCLDKQTQQWTTEVVLRIATPKEYLERIRLQNELFGDETWLEGVTLREGKLSALISQPHIVGRAPRLEEISCFMSAAGCVGCNHFSFLDPIRKIAAFDAQPRNFLRMRDGQVIPFDLILAHLSPELARAYPF